MGRLQTDDEFEEIWKEVTMAQCCLFLTRFRKSERPVPRQKQKQKNETNFVAFSPQANYTDWATAICRRNLVATLVDIRVSRGQRGGSPTAVNLSFLDRGR
jgi:hypothetical protein